VSRRLPLLAAVAFALTAWGASAAQFKPPPAPRQFVTDTAEMLAPNTERQLEARLQAYERDTGHQVIVWTGRTTGDVPLEEWAVRTFEAWGVGSEKLDDGLALFLFSEDRKLRIEVGYGLEGVIPDAIASRVINEIAVPALRAGNPDAAVVGSVNELLLRIGGERGPPQQVPRYAQRPSPSRKVGLGDMIVFLVIGGIFLLLFITNPRLAMFLLFSLMSGGRGGGYGGGGGGGFGGGGGRSGGGGASGSW
jgi:uncharacterized protein